MAKGPNRKIYIEFQMEFRQFFIIFKIYSAIWGRDKSNKSKTMKISPPDLELSPRDDLSIP